MVWHREVLYAMIMMESVIFIIVCDLLSQKHGYATASCSWVGMC